MNKRLFTLLLAILFVLPMAMPAAAVTSTPDELTDATVERVLQEVLTGNITNHTDVLNVALFQYMSQQNTASTYSRSRSANDTPLQIRQVIDQVPDENGNELTTVATTSLLVMDSEGRSISAVEYANYYMQNSGASPEYQVYATHTMYAQVRYGDPNDSSSTQQFIRVTSMRTSLQNSSSYTVTKLVHRYGHEKEFVDLYPGYDEETITYPSTGIYTFYPSSSWLPRNCFGFIQTSVEIFVNGTSFTIVNTQGLSGADWWWMTEY